MFVDGRKNDVNTVDTTFGQQNLSLLSIKKMLSAERLLYI